MWKACAEFTNFKIIVLKASMRPKSVNILTKLLRDIFCYSSLKFWFRFNVQFYWSKWKRTLSPKWSRVLKTSPPKIAHENLIYHLKVWSNSGKRLHFENKVDLFTSPCWKSFISLILNSTQKKNDNDFKTEISTKIYGVLSSNHYLSLYVSINAC